MPDENQNQPGNEAVDAFIQVALRDNDSSDNERDSDVDRDGNDTNVDTSGQGDDGNDDDDDDQNADLDSDDDDLSDGQLDDDPEYQQRIEKLENDKRAAEGRLKALQRKAEKKGFDASSIKGKSIEEISEDWPEIGDALKEVAEATANQTREQVFSELAPQLQYLDSFIENDRQTVRQSKLDALEQAVPDYQAITQDENYWNWVDTKGEVFQRAAESSDPKEVASVLTLYKAEQGIATHSKHTPPPPKQSRRDKLSRHVSIPRANSGGKGGGNTDALSAFISAAEEG